MRLQDIPFAEDIDFAALSQRITGTAAEVKAMLRSAALRAANKGGKEVSICVTF